MKIIKRAMCIFLSMAVLFGALAGCTPENSASVLPTETPPATQTPAPTPTPDAGLKADLVISDFSIVYPQRSLTDSADIEMAAMRLSALVFMKVSANCNAYDDRIDEAQGYTEEEYEILIGKTNRAESQKIWNEGISYYDYVIRFEGKKIVILGGSDEATLNALDHFEQNMLVPELNTIQGMKSMITLDHKYTSAWRTNMRAWIINGIDKISTDTNSGKDLIHYDVYTAKNEAESVQIVINSPEDRDGLDLEITGDYDGIRVEAFYEHSTPAKDGTMLYDALVPLSAKKLSIKKDVAEAMLVRFVTDKSAASGDHEYELKLVDGAGVLYAKFTVTVHVWNFALPDTPTTKTECGILRKYIEKMHGAEKADELYVKYYEFLLDYKMSAYDLPYDVLDDKADKYMSDPRVTTFRVPYSYDDSVMVAMYEKLKTNEDWFKKAYFYPYDEPGTKEAIDVAVSMCERINRLCPGIKTCVPIHRLVDCGEDMDTIDAMSDAFDLWVPKMYLFDTQDVLERMNEYMANGEEVWWYVCWEPADPYCNVLMDQLGVQHRILFWQQVQHNVTGFLYWCTNYWEYVDPWQDPATVKDLSDKVYGDGMLLYNGNEVGIDAPCASFRLAAISDGLDDADLLNMAKELFGADWVNEKIGEITTSLTEYSKSSEALEQMRIEIGNAVNSQLNK